MKDENLDFLIPEEREDGMRMLWGTVMDNGQVLLDRDRWGGQSLPLSIPSLMPLVPGTRVAVDELGRSLRVTGQLHFPHDPNAWWLTETVHFATVVSIDPLTLDPEEEFEENFDASDATVLVSPLNVDDYVRYAIRDGKVTITGKHWKDPVVVRPEMDDAIGEATKDLAVVDTDPPQAPSKLTVTERYGVLIPHWDGLGEDAQPMPEDFTTATVYEALSATAADEEWSAVGDLGGAGSIPVAGREAEVLVFFRAEAMDSSGNRSVFGPVSEGVAPSVLVDVGDIENVLETVRGEMATAKQEADAHFEELDQKTDSARTDLDDARTRLSTAESTLAPLPGEVADAKQSASEASDAAIAAEARATEANNRSMTRLANGNFEDGLKYWRAVGAVSLTEDAHSGGQAVTLGAGGVLITETAMPVVQGQIWEASFFLKGESTSSVRFILDGFNADGEAVTIGASSTAYGTGGWSASPVYRRTIPDGADLAQLRILHSGGNPVEIDDVVLRDVTDVVRLELAAQEAKKAGEDAASAASAVALRVDGVDTRLDDAEQVLEDAGVEGATNLSTLDQRLTTAFQQADSTVASNASTDATQKADAAQDEALRLAKLDATEKADTAEANAKRDAATDAQEKLDAARAHANYMASQGANVIPDPQVKTDLWHLLAGGEVHNSDGRTAGMIELNTAGNTFAFALTRDLDDLPRNYTDAATFPVVPGDVWEFSAWYRTSADYTPASPNYSGIRIGQPDGSYVTRPAGLATHSTEWTQMVGRWEVPDGMTAIQLTIFKAQSAGSIYWSDFLAHNVTGLASAEEDLAAAQVRADEAHSEAGKAWNHADAAMTSAANAKTDAIAHADALPKVLHGTSGPSGTAPDGSTWEQHAGPGLATPVEAKWTRVNGSWQNTPIDGKAVSNMDIGYLTAGGATIDTAVVNEMWSALTVTERLIAITGWIGGVMLEDGAVTADKITVTNELITDIFGANRALIEDELVVNGQLIANNADLISAAMRSLSVTEKATFATAFADQFWAKMAVIQKLKAQSAWITDAMISSIDSETINVTESLWAALGQFVEIEAGMVKGNAFEGQTFTGGTFTGTIIEGGLIRQTGSTPNGVAVESELRTGGYGPGLYFEAPAGSEAGTVTALENGYGVKMHAAPQTGDAMAATVMTSVEAAWVAAASPTNEWQNYLNITRSGAQMSSDDGGFVYIRSQNDATGMNSVIRVDEGRARMRTYQGSNAASLEVSPTEVTADAPAGLWVTEDDFGQGRVVLKGEWTMASLANGWEEYSTFSIGVAYKRDSDRKVTFTGAVRRGTTGLSNYIFKIPAAWSGGKYRLLSAVGMGGVAVDLRVSSNGEVYVSAPEDFGWVTLDQVSFYSDLTY